MIIKKDCDKKVVTKLRLLGINFRSFLQKDFAHKKST